MKFRTLVLLLLLSVFVGVQAREVVSLNEGWTSICYPEGRTDSIFVKNINLPHNWNDYYAYLPGSKQNNLYGLCRYERSFTVNTPNNESVFLRLEGVGSYVTVLVNGKEVCNHQPAGMVVTTLDITSFLYAGDRNRLTIICDHPSQNEDMPWVYDPEHGMGVTSVPFGLFRDVALEVVSGIRIVPYGVHTWLNEACDTLYVETEVHNYSSHGEECRLNTEFEVLMSHKSFVLGAHLSETILQRFAIKKFNLDRWTPENPKTYKLTSKLMLGFKQVLADQVDTQVGITSVKWPARNADGSLADGDHRFYLNGAPYFINGTTEAEHNFGNGYAFSPEECERRVSVSRYMGFNTFADFFAPHNLQYMEAINAEGMLWYPQFSARVWHDTPAFRENFKKLLAQWVKERRNSPGIILWGLQYDNVMPEDFVKECRDLIHQLDRHASRMVVTSSFDVPATQGADWHLTASDPVLPTYGFSRSAGNSASELQFCEQIHSQMSQAWLNRSNTCGQIQDALFSYPTPGKPMLQEQARAIDQAGSFNDHGIFTSFWEPTDAYYLYLAWADFLRHTIANGSKADSPGKSATEMVVYGYNADNMPLPEYLIQYDNKALKRNFAKTTPLLRGTTQDVAYLYRLNCGGDEVVDSQGQIWMGDDTRYSSSWAQTDRFKGEKLCPVLGSQAYVPGLAMIPEDGNPDKSQWVAKEDQELLRTYRWGRQDLKYTFPVPPGKVYQVDVYFVNTRHFVHKVSYKTRAGKDGLVTVNFQKIKIGQQKMAAIAIGMQRYDSSDFGSLDRRGNFTFKESTLKILRELSPSHFESKGYPYSEGKTWADLMKM